MIIGARDCCGDYATVPSTGDPGPVLLVCDACGGGSYRLVIMAEVTDWDLALADVEAEGGVRWARDPEGYGPDIEAEGASTTTEGRMEHG